MDIISTYTYESKISNDYVCMTIDFESESEEMLKWNEINYWIRFSYLNHINNGTVLYSTVLTTAVHIHIPGPRYEIGLHWDSERDNILKLQ